MPTMTYAHFRDVPETAWRWPSFSPAEIACRGTGAIKINTEAMDRLQALRSELGKPLIVRSTYRSPSHNRAVGGAPASRHMLGTAFDIAMSNHDPAAFAEAARDVGFLGFGTYPRSAPVPFDFAPPDRRNHWRLVALSLAMLLPSLGTSIANVALPTLALSFDASFEEVQWVVIAYLLAVTALIVGAARLGDTLGRRPLLLSGIGIFAVASAICAAAPSLWVLVAARSVQGLGAAIMMALTVALVGDIVPKDRTGSAMGLLGTVSAVGTALGPSLGGALIAWSGWPAVFVFMAGFGVVALAVGRWVFPADAPVEREPSRFDLAGMALLALFANSICVGDDLGPCCARSGPCRTRRHIRPRPYRLCRAGGADRGPTGPVGAAAQSHPKRGSPLLRAGLHDHDGNPDRRTFLPFWRSRPWACGNRAGHVDRTRRRRDHRYSGRPAGRPPGGFRVAVTGLAGVTTGSILMMVLPGVFGVGGYIGGLALITAGYALFQAANTTAVMNGAATDRRGVTSALLGLSRNLGLIAGATAMGTLFTLGARGIEMLGHAPGEDAGLQLTFAAAAGFAGLALGIAVRGRARG